MNSDCIFCKIVAGEIPCYKIYEDDNYLAFLDISQFTEGHTLIIPKIHYRFIWDIPQIEGLFKVAQKITINYQSLGYRYVDSLSFGRQVAHAHLHLVPHNGDASEWNTALKSLEVFSNSIETRLKPTKALELTNKLKLN